MSDPSEGIEPTQQQELALSLEIRILVDDIALQTYSGDLVPTCSSVATRCVKQEGFNTLEAYIEAARVIHVRLLQEYRVVIDEQRLMKEGDSEHLPPGVVVADYVLASEQMTPRFTMHAQMTASERD